MTTPATLLLSPRIQINVAFASFLVVTSPTLHFLHAEASGALLSPTWSPTTEHMEVWGTFSILPLDSYSILHDG